AFSKPRRPPSAEWERTRQSARNDRAEQKYFGRRKWSQRCDNASVQIFLTIAGLDDDGRTFGRIRRQQMRHTQRFWLANANARRLRRNRRDGKGGYRRSLAKLRDSFAARVLADSSNIL